MLTKLTERGRKTIREHPERVQEVNREIEHIGTGARVTAQWALLGPYDFATIVFAPDNWCMSYIALELGARGTVETLTMPALRVEDFVSFMQAEDKATHQTHEHP
jgi:uncharacterized protein with GYD domain